MADAKPGPDVAQLVADHHQAVYRYAYRLTGSTHDAEDLTQEVFLTAQRKMDRLRNLGAAHAWLFAILRNCFLRDRARRRPERAVDLALNVDSVADDRPQGIDGEIDAKIDQAKLQEALDRLPEDSRTAVVMFYFEECSYREIAEQLDLPIGTVMSRLARAKDRLRVLLSESDRSEADREKKKRNELLVP